MHVCALEREERKRQRKRERERGCVCVGGWLGECLYVRTCVLACMCAQGKESERQRKNEKICMHHVCVPDSLLVLYMFFVCARELESAHARTRERQCACWVGAGCVRACVCV